MIDSEGYRYNVAIVMINRRGQVFWARRIKQDSWQFPQGGLNEGESAMAALYRELYEEVGLRPHHVTVLAATPGWLRYQLPERMQRADSTFVGQKQKWFLLQLTAPDRTVHLKATGHPEFDRWRWVEYFYPLDQVIPFKRHVYRKALERFYPVVQSIRREAKKSKTITIESNQHKDSHD